jgi:hemerythrin superfamily protein
MTTRTKNAATAGNADAIALLKADHRRVQGLFKEFAAIKKNGGGDRSKHDTVAEICRELRIHTELEEEIFYPAVRAQIEDADLMDEALVEHAGAKELVGQLEAMDAEDELYDAKVTVLGEQIGHHVKEEEGEMFPKAKKAKVNTAELWMKMSERKAALQENLDEDNGTGTRHAAHGRVVSKELPKGRS